MPGMSSERWLILVVLVVVRTTMGFQFQSIGSLGPMLVAQFDISYAALGTLIGLYLLPGVIIALPGGVLGSRFGSRQVAYGGLTMMVAGGAVMTASTSFTALVAGRLISGAGAVLMNVAVTKMVADWFIGREIRTAMAVLVVSWPLGLALGLSLFAPLAAMIGSEGVMAAAGLACLVALTLLALTYRPPPGMVEVESGQVTALSTREWRLVLIAGLIWGIYNVAYIVLISFLPSLFAAQGYSLAEAGAITSLMGWALIALVPVGGHLADRNKRPDLVIVAGFAATAGATLLLPIPELTLMAYAIVLLAGGLPAGAIMALPAMALRPETRAFGMGIYFTCYYAFMAAFPTLSGLTWDLTQNVAAPMWFSSFMLVLAMLGLAAFRTVARRDESTG
jgi:predicted MFS family arabinose efflux permease